MEAQFKYILFVVHIYWVVKPLKCVFYYLKDRGPLKNSKKNCGNVEEYKAHQLIPLTPPLFFHFTLPLMLCKKFYYALTSFYRVKKKNSLAKSRVFCSSSVNFRSFPNDRNTFNKKKQWLKPIEVFRNSRFSYALLINLTSYYDLENFSSLTSVYELCTIFLCCLQRGVEAPHISDFGELQLATLRM